MAHPRLHRGMVVKFEYHHTDAKSWMNGHYVVLRATIHNVWYSKLHKQRFTLNEPSTGEYDYTIHRDDARYIRITPLIYKLDPIRLKKTIS